MEVYVRVLSHLLLIHLSGANTKWKCAKVSDLLIQATQNQLFSKPWNPLKHKHSKISL